MARHFSIEEIEELRRQLVGNSVKDTDMEDASAFQKSDTVAIVQSGKNKRITMDTMVDCLINGIDEDFTKHEKEREANEAARIANEENRVIEEAHRVAFENTRLKNESERVTAENNRNNAETVRVANERDRQTTESSRQQFERERRQAEDDRESAENTRVAAESARETNEQERKDAEDERKLNETERISNENKRLAAETNRIDAEKERVQAEIERNKEIADIKEYVAEATADGAVTTAKLADGAVTPEKLSQSYVPTDGGKVTGVLEVSELHIAKHKTAVCPISMTTDTLGILTFNVEGCTDPEIILRNVYYPSQDFDAANKKYVDDLLPIHRGSGMDSITQSVKDATASEASGGRAIALGTSTTAANWDSIAVGNKTKATGFQAIATGQDTNANGQASISGGIGSVTAGSASMAVGQGVVANGGNSQAFGNNTKTTQWEEFAVGKFNNSNEGTAFSIGIGEEDSHRKNAIEILKSGNAYLYGIGGYDGTNPNNSTDIATYLTTATTDEINNLFN